jgi:hypothetical protein
MNINQPDPYGAWRHLDGKPDVALRSVRPIDATDGSLAGVKVVLEPGLLCLPAPDDEDTL